MRKMILAALLLIASSAAFAQNGIGKTTIKPAVGINFANMTDADNSKVRVGAVIGAEFETGVADIVSVSYGAFYSMQGVKSSEGAVDYTMKLDYINIPVLVNAYVAKGFAVKLGLQPGFNVNKSMTAKTGGNSISGSLNSDNINTFELALPIGLSYEINNFVIDGRYNFGLTKPVKEASTKHSVFMLTVGYKFAL